MRDQNYEEGSPVVVFRSNAGRWMEIRPAEVNRLRKIFLYSLEQHLNFKPNFKDNEAWFFSPGIGRLHGYQIVAPPEFAELFAKKTSVYHWKSEMLNCVPLLLKDNYIRFIRPVYTGEVVAPRLRKQNSAKKPKFVSAAKRSRKSNSATHQSSVNNEDRAAHNSAHNDRVLRRRGKVISYEDPSDIDDIVNTITLESSDNEINRPSNPASKNKRKRSLNLSEVSRNGGADGVALQPNTTFKKQKVTGMTTPARSTSPSLFSEFGSDAEPTTPTLPHAQPPEEPLPLPTKQDTYPRPSTAFTRTSLTNPPQSPLPNPPSESRPSAKQITSLLSLEILKTQESIERATNHVSKTLLESELDILKKRYAECHQLVEAETSIDELQLNVSSKERMKLSLQELIIKEIEEKGIFGGKQ